MSPVALIELFAELSEVSSAAMVSVDDEIDEESEPNPVERLDENDDQAVDKELDAVDSELDAVDQAVLNELPPVDMLAETDDQAVDSDVPAVDNETLPEASMLACVLSAVETETLTLLTCAPVMAAVLVLVRGVTA